MFFDDNDILDEPKERELPEAGEYVCEIVSAEEKEIPWNKPDPGLFIFLRNPAGVQFEVICKLAEDYGKRKAAVLCMSAGIEPMGTVDPQDLVGRLVGTEVRLQTAQSGRVYPTVSRFFEPPRETKPAAAAKPVDPTSKADVPW